MGNTVFKSPFGVVIFLFENGNRKKGRFLFNWDIWSGHRVRWHSLIGVRWGATESDIESMVMFKYGHYVSFLLLAIMAYK